MNCPGAKRGERDPDMLNPSSAVVVKFGRYSVEAMPRSVSSWST
jgi:hypothetical protein